MKKLLVALLALCIVGVAFAQDAAPALKWSGYLNIGGAYDDNQNVAGGTNNWGVNGWDSGTQGRMNLNGSYTNGDFGVAFRARVDSTFGTTNTIFLRRGYGWQKFLGGMVKVQAGRLGDYTWSSANGAYNAFGNFDGPVGIQLQVMPMDGLNFGIFVPTTTVATTMSNAFQSSSLGLAYTQKDTFDVQLGYAMSPTANQGDFWLGGDVYAVKDLTFWFEAQMKNLGDSATGATYALVNGEYALGALSAGAWVNFETFQASGSDVQFSLYPNVTYTLNDTTAVDLGVWYGLAGSKNGLSVDPDLLLTVNKNSTVRIGGSFASGDFAETKGEGAWGARTSQISGFVDFVYNF